MNSMQVVKHSNNIKTMPWQLPLSYINQANAINFIQNPDTQRNETHKTIKNTIQHENVHPLLFNLVEAILNAPESKQKTSALMELFAGMAYTTTNPKSGKLHMIRAGMKHCDADIRKKIAHVFRSKIRQLSPQNQSMWFTLRSACVDLYVATLLGVSKLQDMIFYGGESHVQNIQSYLDALGAQRIQSDPLGILNFTKNKDLYTVTQYRHKNNTIGLIGENHGETRKEFADSFLVYMRGRCNIDPSKVLTILLEKHFTRDKSDTVQCTLMCNQPNTALHRLRCNLFTETNECNSLRVLAVDNRHYDLGFLRGEFMDAWTWVHPHAEAFQSEIKKRIVEYVEQLSMQL